MEALDWNKIFNVAKETLVKRQKPTGSGIKRAGGAKKVLAVRKLKGGDRIYPCWFCRAMGFKGGRRSPERLVTHIENRHGFAKKQSEDIQKQWNEDNPTVKNDLKYEASEKKLPELGKKDISRTDLEEAAKDGTQMQKDVLFSIKVALGEEKPPVEEPVSEDVKTESKEEEKTDPEEELKAKKKKKKLKMEKLLEGALGKYMKTKKKKTPKEKQDEAYEALAKESAKPEPGVGDIMKLMKAQQGELAPEEKTELSELGKATVAKIKKRASTSKAAQADKANIGAKFKALEKSKLKRIPAKEIKVTSKVRGKGKKPTLIISNA